MEGPSHPSDPGSSSDGRRPHALGSRYELEERLGVGAMGEVWRALDRHTGRHLAAKVLRAEFARDTDIVTRFIQERSILLGLTHPNIVRVRDLVVEGERLAIVMDLVEGGDLRRHLRERGPVASEHAVPLACVVLDALASAHATGCLHRDVKPDNVLLVGGDVSRPQDARLSDFSIARLAQESTVQSTGLLGTPGYMPPELFRDGQFSGASDVYATGVLLYELLGGRTPFAGAGTAHTIGNRHVSSAPPPLPVAAPLWAVVDRMLDKDPRARLGAAETAAALRALPRDALASEPLPVQPVPDSWESVDHTVLRASPLAGRHSAGGPEVETVGILGTAASGGTDHDGTGDTGSSGSTDNFGLTRPGGGRRVAGRPAPGEVAARDEAQPDRRLWWVAAAVVVLLLVAGLAYGASRGGDPASADDPVDPDPSSGGAVVTAQLTDPTLPTGLTVGRTATYDPASDKLDLTLTYAASAAPLEGPFLEVFPPGAVDGDCPLAAWKGAEQLRTTLSATGVTTASDCPAYAVEVPDLAPQQRKEVGVVLSGVGLDVAGDPGALQTWLTQMSAAASEALSGSSVGDDQFPVQRLARIEVSTPFRVALRDEIRVEISPVFVSGDTGPAFYDSTVTGSSDASLFLEKIAGGYSGVRLSGCDSVDVTKDKLRVSALRATDDCVIEAEVGKLLSGQDTVSIDGAGS